MGFFKIKKIIKDGNNQVDYDINKGFIRDEGLESDNKTKQKTTIRKTYTVANKSEPYVKKNVTVIKKDDSFDSKKFFEKKDNPNEITTFEMNDWFFTKTIEPNRTLSDSLNEDNAHIIFDKELPKIDMYVLCWNEEKIIPYFLKHYENFVNNIYVYDNTSNDNSINLLNSHPKVTIIQYDTNGEIRDDAYLQIKNTTWKNSIGKADIVIVCDMDEFLYSDDLKKSINNFYKSDATVIKPTGYDMITSEFEFNYNDKLTNLVKTGYKNNLYDKLVMFKTKNITEINYIAGCHNAAPIGDKVKLFEGEFLLLHYKRLGLKYFLNKMSNYKKRLSGFNKKYKFGYEYEFNDDKHTKDFNISLSKISDVIYKNFDIKNLSQDFLDYSGFDDNFTGYLNDKKLYLKVYDVVKNIESKTRIPKIVHLCYGFSQKCDFEFFNYLCILTIVNKIKPDKIILYHHYEITGKWWDRAKCYLTTIQTNLVTNVLGMHVTHFAHMSDIIRLEMLRFVGGIYMDIDTFVNKSFDNLLDNEFVMGIQNSPGKQERDYYGLCNALMLSEKNSLFSNKWLTEYNTFDEKIWDYHSVIKPYYLAKEYPNNITIFNEKNFFPFIWSETYDYLFKYNEEYAEIIKDCYSMHLWETITKNDLLRLSYNTILSDKINLSIVFKDFILNNTDKSVSFVFLTHNRPEKTIDYINTYINVLYRNDIKELLIYDNYSTNDELLTYLRKIEKENTKVRVIYGLENIGVAGGRDVLFKEAKGDIIFSLDSDSKLINDRFIDEAKEILNDPGIWICGTTGSYFKNWEFHSHEDLNDDNYYEGDVDAISGCCQIFRRDLLDKVKMDLAFKPFWYEDTDFCFQALHLNGINYRFHCKDNFLHKWGGSGSIIFGNELFGEKHKIFKGKWVNKIEKNLKFNKKTKL